MTERGGGGGVSWVDVVGNNSVCSKTAVRIRGHHLTPVPVVWLWLLAAGVGAAAPSVFFGGSQLFSSPSVASGSTGVSTGSGAGAGAVVLLCQPPFQAPAPPLFGLTLRWTVVLSSLMQGCRRIMCMVCICLWWCVLPPPPAPPCFCFGIYAAGLLAQPSLSMTPAPAPPPRIDAQSLTSLLELSCGAQSMDGLLVVASVLLDHCIAAVAHRCAVAPAVPAVLFTWRMCSVCCHCSFPVGFAPLLLLLQRSLL